MHRLIWVFVVRIWPNRFSHDVVHFDYWKALVWAASSEFGTYRLCEQRTFRRAFASAQSCQNLRYSLIQVKRNRQTESQIPGPSEWLGIRLKFVMTECSKTQICLTWLSLISDNSSRGHKIWDSMTATLCRHCRRHFCSISSQTLWGLGGGGGGGGDTGQNLELRKKIPLNGK